MPIQHGICAGHRLKWLPDGTIAHKPPYTIHVRDAMGQPASRPVQVSTYERVLIYNEGTVNHVRVLMTDRDAVTVAWQDVRIEPGYFLRLFDERLP
jgi:hypothetical protein